MDLDQQTAAKKFIRDRLVVHVDRLQRYDETAQVGERVSNSRQHPVDNNLVNRQRPVAAIDNRARTGSRTLHRRLHRSAHPSNSETRCVVFLRLTTKTTPEVFASFIVLVEQSEIT